MNKGEQKKPLKMQAISGDCLPKLFLGNPIHTPTTKIVDFGAVVSCFLMGIVLPIAAHYFPESHDANGRMTPIIKLLLINLPICGLGGIWLVFRYAKVGLTKYPLIRKMLSPQFRLLTAFGFIFAYWLGYEILKNVLWS